MTDDCIDIHTFPMTSSLKYFLSSFQNLSWRALPHRDQAQ